MGLAVFHGHHLDGGFTLPFYKMLLNKPITLDDITHVDPELHRSLTWMLCVASRLFLLPSSTLIDYFDLIYRENDISGVIDTTFSVEHNAYGAIQVHDLKPDGRDMVVSDENKREYVRYATRLLKQYSWAYHFPAFFLFFFLLLFLDYRCGRGRPNGRYCPAVSPYKGFFSDVAGCG